MLQPWFDERALLYPSTSLRPDCCGNFCFGIHYDIAANDFRRCTASQGTIISDKESEVWIEEFTRSNSTHTEKYLLLICVFNPAQSEQRIDFLVPGSSTKARKHGYCYSQTATILAQPHSLSSWGIFVVGVCLNRYCQTKLCPKVFKAFHLSKASTKSLYYFMFCKGANLFLA